jgi:hypothetical protein
MFAMRRFLYLLLLLSLMPQPVWAGLYYTDEPMAELPSQWRGFLLDQQTLRTLAVAPQPGTPDNPLRAQYLKKAEDLEKDRDKLSADQLADLGAIWVRLGRSDKAVEVLEKASRQHPNHFAIAANLGTAWQLQGDLQRAMLNLQTAHRLAPGKWAEAEKYHLKLVLARLKEKKDSMNLDDLFGVTYGTGKGQYEAGKMSESEKQKLPKNAVAVVQQLCLWLPADERLLWQLAEIANAHGDIQTAGNIMDGLVTQYNFRTPDLREHRQIVKLAAEKLPASTNKEDHQQHVGGSIAKSKRPLLTRLDQSILPPISATALNRLPWALLKETEMERQTFRPTFPEYLKDLNGKNVTLNGFMQPFTEELDVTAFMFIEYPIGCWYCENPELTSIILVETPKGHTATYTRGLVRVSGQLTLNSTDPEEFLYIIRNAKVGGVD